MAVSAIAYPAEREMNRFQRNLMDGCFEEGHYEAGISILDKLRLQHYRPSTSHIRQLIYMALYPPPRKQERVPKEAVGMPTPSKPIPSSKQNHTTYTPSPAATEASLALLQTLSLTNTAQGLFQAIPSYPLTGSERQTAEASTGRPVFRESEDFGADDSQIARDAAVIKECRDCWSVLSYGVVKRKDERMAGASRMTRAYDDNDEYHDDDAEDDSQLLVGKHSWPILDWFACLFRKDRDTNDDKYSICLLTQIRPSRLNAQVRSDVEQPLSIILACYRQEDVKRRRIGASLMSSLIDLTRCKHFSTSQLLLSTSVKLGTMDYDSLFAFLSDLPVDKYGLAFKLALCDKFLQESVAGRDLTKTQARRARPLVAKALSGDASFSGSDSVSRLNSPYPFTPPSAARVGQIFSSGHRTHDRNILHDVIAFHLLIAFGNYNAIGTHDGSDDIAWKTLLHDEQFKNDVASFFDHSLALQDDEIKLRRMQDVSSLMISSWVQ